MKRQQKIAALFMMVLLFVVFAITDFADTQAAEAPNYLTFTAEQAGSTVSFKYESGSDIEYSTNGGTAWNAYTKGSQITLAAIGDKVMFRGSSVETTSFDHFSMTGKIAGSGSVTSLTDGVGNDTNVILSFGCYGNMFRGCKSLTSAPELPATTLEARCYMSMFEGCTGLTSAPELPATTLAGECYNSMFSYCTSLSSAPELPATTLAGRCYVGMFSGCTGLSSAPKLPATTLADDCYMSMFENCTGLSSVPELSATTLADFCYYSMFMGCTSLSNAPELPATTLASQCYSNMFRNCTSLTSAPELPATTLANECYWDMFMGCTSLSNAPELLATTLASGCYGSMFEGCTGLTSTPELPATTLADSCYYGMFKDCKSLTSVPELPATTLANECYANMFKGCTGLSIKKTKDENCFVEWKIPVESTTETNAVYNMFYACPSVECAPTPEVNTVYYQFGAHNSHVWDSGKTTTNPSCGKEGVKTYTCIICNETKTESIPATDEHSWDAGTVTKQPTTTSTGVKTYTCTVCKLTKTETIDKLSDSTNPGTTNPGTTNPGTPSTPTPVPVDNIITASNFTKTYATKVQSFSIGAKANGGAAMTYSTNNASVAVNSAGVVTVKAKFIGQATITIKSAATTAYRAAQKMITVTVTPTKTAIASAANIKGKKIKVKWRKNAVGTGYQVQYSTNNKFAKGNKTVTVKSNKTIATTLSKLAKGKTYYVRMRTYKTVSNKKYYSDWSAVKKVKIKK